MKNDICSRCNGSGEGQHETTQCLDCNGTGSSYAARKLREQKELIDCMKEDRADAKRDEDDRY